MLIKTRAKYLKFLYNFKSELKILETGLIINEGNANILELITEGFHKLEYIHLLENKEALSLIIGKVDYEEPENLDVKKAYAFFSAFVTLIGYLDAVCAKNYDLYASLSKENSASSILAAQRIASSANLRKTVFDDYFEEKTSEEDKFIKEILGKNPAYENFSKLINQTRQNQQDNFIASGLIQAYMEGFKREDGTDIGVITAHYHECKEKYHQYRQKCEKDKERIKALLPNKK